MEIDRIMGIFLRPGKEHLFDTFLFRELNEIMRFENERRPEIVKNEIRIEISTNLWY